MTYLEQLPQAVNHKSEEPSLCMLIASASRSFKLPILTQYTHILEYGLTSPSQGRGKKCVNSTFRDRQILQKLQHVQLRYKVIEKR